jgi:hypothetical protein
MRGRHDYLAANEAVALVPGSLNQAESEQDFTKHLGKA